MPVPLLNLTSGPSRSRISRVAGADAAVLSFMADRAFGRYRIEVVGSANALPGTGVLVEQGAGAAANTAVTVDVTSAELEAVAPGEVPRLLAVFVREDAPGLWGDSPGSWAAQTEPWGHTRSWSGTAWQEGAGRLWSDHPYPWNLWRVL